jgi:glycosyltransferase involved in cell wall biosynthesis
MDKTGLGNQTRLLTQMLKPDYLLIINSGTHFKTPQFLEWYSGFNSIVTNGLIPNTQEYRQFLHNVDAFITCETPYNWRIMADANRDMKKSYIQYNYEFLDHLQNNRLPLPTKFLAPSYWNTEKVKDLYGDRVVYLPPPINLQEFRNNRELNFNRSGVRRFLHVIGKPAIHDRNGTEIVLEALKHTNANFELVITSQHELKSEVKDKRVTVDTSNNDDFTTLYKDFDAMILPRRFGGLCLPMNEALASGLPVIMSDVSPNKKALPKKWLINATKTSEFMTRTMIDIYTANAKSLAKKIDWLCSLDNKELGQEKLEAFDIAHNNYSFSVLKPLYEDLWTQ